MSQPPSGYRDIPEGDRRKAKAFFDRGSSVAATGNYDYAIEMYLQGFMLDPDSVEAHQALRDISLRRKASGGKALGMFEAMKLKRNGKEDKQNVVNYVKLLAYDPGNTGVMLGLMQNAVEAGFYDTAMWIGPILQKANTELPKPDFNTYIALKDAYKAMGRWKLATDACQYAAMLRPDDMDLTTELKNLGAQHTMDAGNYGTAGSFRGSVRDADTQQRLLDQDKDVRDVDILTRLVNEAEAEWKASPDEPGKIMKFADALIKTENPDNENRAIDVLASAYERLKQFRYRHAIGKIKLMQLQRADRMYKTQLQQAPNDEGLKAEYNKFLIDKAEEELSEFSLSAEHYPTDLSYKYEVGRRLYALQRYSDAIPIFQTARQDPKIKTDATTLLARSFFEAGFIDEAVDTLRAQIEEYQLKGDARSKDMYYWYARSLAAANEIQQALKAFSQVAQWDFNFRDVQQWIKKLRTQPVA